MMNRKIANFSQPLKGSYPTHTLIIGLIQKLPFDLGTAAIQILKSAQTHMALQMHVHLTRYHILLSSRMGVSPQKSEVNTASKGYL